VFEGSLVAIHIAPHAGSPMTSVPRVRAVVGKGLEGDRNYGATGTPSRPRQPAHEVTLIEEEATAAVNAEGGGAHPPLAPKDTRRNLVTRGVPLNHLVGRDFWIGPVLLRGHRLCEPCKHLESTTREGVLQALLHRGGLRAEVLIEGVLEPGQAIRPA